MKNRSEDAELLTSGDGAFAKRKLFFRILFVLIIFAAAAVDQLTKYLAVQNVKPVGKINLIKLGDTEVLNFTYCENTGMSFSLLEGQTWFLILVPVILLIGVVWFEFSGKTAKYRRPDVEIALAFLAGGGLGNLIDRILLGYVVDFIDVKLINFAIFNFADICDVCGGIYVCIVFAFIEISEDRKKKTAPEKKTDGKT
ncbi:MAG: signal peptidase II [Ruminiclostridium sp.]|nr:signal peptidase II [Ruminiclostridium sp.]